MLALLVDAEDGALDHVVLRSHVVVRFAHASVTRPFSKAYATPGFCFIVDRSGRGARGGRGP